MAGQSNQQAHTAHDASPRARERAAAAARVARAALAGCLAACFALPAHAKYDVDIDAPRSIRKLLKTHLDIARFAKRDDISDDQFDFLVTATPQQVRDLTATAGYFSVVRTDVRTRDGKRDVRIAVDPGKQTIVSSVDLTFKAHRHRGSEAGGRDPFRVLAEAGRSVHAVRLGRREGRGAQATAVAPLSRREDRVVGGAHRPAHAARDARGHVRQRPDVHDRQGRRRRRAALSGKDRHERQSAVGRRDLRRAADHRAAAAVAEHAVLRERRDRRRRRYGEARAHARAREGQRVSVQQHPRRRRLCHRYPAARAGSRISTRSVPRGR